MVTRGRAQLQGGTEEEDDEVEGVEGKTLDSPSA